MGFSFVVFGITGNLAQIKLIPALYDLAKNDLLPDKFSVIGVARSQMGKSEFDSYLHEVLNSSREPGNEIEQKVHDQLCARAQYISGDFKDPQLYRRLSGELGQNDKMFYLATYPELYEDIFRNLKESGLSGDGRGWTRLIIEKPLGTDLQTARELNGLLSKYFEESQIFRLDHYLGKETLQNIINFRFGNSIFDPLINREYVDHIQITAAEDFGIGERAGYYEKVGALRDVGQNHLLQMLALTTMDEPNGFSNEEITAKRIELLKSLEPQEVVFGQYESYKDEKGVGEGSETDTFFALKANINSDRFRGVPVYMRAGKKLAQSVTEVSFVFKQPTGEIFSDIDCGDERNVLIYRIKPNEGIVLKILAKAPGHERKTVPSFMQFCYAQLEGMPADPYERLIHDALKGDHTFFNDALEVEAQWEFVDPLINDRSVIVYEDGSWGPEEADDLIRKDGREWLVPSLEFCKL